MITMGVSSKVGSAQYATTITRLDAAKATAFLAQFLSNPSLELLHAIAGVIAYLYHTRWRAICFHRTTSDLPSVELSSDALYGDNHDRKSSAGYLCKIFGGSVDWKAAKQRTVTTSTTEAELLGVSESVKSFCMWLRIFDKVNFSLRHPLSLLCDNKQTVQLLTKEAPRLRTRLRHIDIHQHWLRQEVQAGRVPVEWVSTENMPADGLTKILPRQSHARFVRQLGLEDIEHLVDW